MAFIYCGGTTDDIPLFCVDVGCIKILFYRRNITTGTFSFMEIGRNDRRNRTTLLSGQVLDNHIQEI